MPNTEWIAAVPYLDCPVQLSCQRSIICGSEIFWENIKISIHFVWVFLFFGGGGGGLSFLFYFILSMHLPTFHLSHNVLKLIAVKNFLTKTPKRTLLSVFFMLTDWKKHGKRMCGCFLWSLKTKSKEGKKYKFFVVSLSLSFTYSLKRNNFTWWSNMIGQFPQILQRLTNSTVLFRQMSFYFSLETGITYLSLPLILSRSFPLSLSFFICLSLSFSQEIIPVSRLIFCLIYRLTDLITMYY